MKKVTAFVGSAHKRNTHDAAMKFMKNLQTLGDVEYEIVTLSDYNLRMCRGCQLCTVKGEEFCPLKDDRDLLIDKIMSSDGVVFASPNYCFQLSGIMKVFLDRFSFLLHRPRCFGKTFTSIVTQGIGRGMEIVKYFDFIGNFLGFNTVKGACVTVLDPRTEKDQQKFDRAIEQLSKRYYAKLVKPAYPVPSMLRLMIFRMGRTMMHKMLDDRNRDFRYYTEKGWFQSDFYYPIRLGVLKKATGKLFDSMATLIQKMIA
jgi:multimeric flavodoxin WrbA